MQSPHCPLWLRKRYAKHNRDKKQRAGADPRTAAVAGGLAGSGEFEPKLQERSSCTTFAFRHCDFAAGSGNALCVLLLYGSGSRIGILKYKNIARKLCCRSSGCKIASFGYKSCTRSAFPQFRLKTQVPSTQPAHEERCSSGFKIASFEYKSSTRIAFPQLRLKTQVSSMQAAREEHSRSSGSQIVTFLSTKVARKVR